MTLINDGGSIMSEDEFAAAHMEGDRLRLLQLEKEAKSRRYKLRGVTIIYILFVLVTLVLPAIYWISKQLAIFKYLGE